MSSVGSPLVTLFEMAETEQITESLGHLSNENDNIDGKSLPHGLGLLTTVASLPPKYRNRYLNMRTKFEIPLDLSVKQLLPQIDNNVPMAINFTEVYTESNCKNIDYQAHKQSVTKIFHNAIDHDTLKQIHIVNTSNNGNVTDQISMDNNNSRNMNNNNNNLMIVNADIIMADQEKEREDEQKEISRGDYLKIRKFSRHVKAMTPPLASIKQMGDLEACSNDGTKEYGLKYQYLNSNESESTPTKICRVESVKGKISKLEDLELKLNFEGGTQRQQHITPPTKSIQATNKVQINYKNRKQNEKHKTNDQTNIKSNTAYIDKRMRANTNISTGINSDIKTYNCNSELNCRNGGSHKDNNNCRKSVNNGEKNNRSNGYINNRPKVTRKLKFDEETSSPVSGTIIRPLDDITDDTIHYSNGDIDPKYNIVEITKETKAELAAIKNIIGDYICKLCRIKFEDAFGLAQHRCACIVLLEYRCAECGKQFNCPANLASHRRWHKPRKDNNINNITDNSNNSNKYPHHHYHHHQHHHHHQQQHNDHEKLNASHAHHTSSTKENRLTKSSSISPLASLGHCNKNDSNNCLININAKFTKPQGNYNCKDCGKKFKRQAYLKKHQIIHNRHNNKNKDNHNDNDNDSDDDDDDDDSVNEDNECNNTSKKNTNINGLSKEIRKNSANNNKLSIIHKLARGNKKSIKSPEKPNRPLEEEMKGSEESTSLNSDKLLIDLNEYKSFKNLLTNNDCGNDRDNLSQRKNKFEAETEIETEKERETSEERKEQNFQNRIEVGEAMNGEDSDELSNLFECSNSTSTSLTSRSYGRLQIIESDLTEEENIAAAALTHLRNCASVIQHTTTLAH